MLSAGIDVGAKTVKIAAAADGEVIGRAVAPAGYDVAAAVRKAWSELGALRDRVEALAAVGAGRRGVEGADGYVSEAAAAARGAFALFPEARVVIDVGFEDGRAVKLDAAGKAVDFVVNEKCAAGAGAFVESMARALEVSPGELGRMSLAAQGRAAMNAQCVVFAESELVGLLHAGVPKPDIARAVHEAVAERVVSMTRRAGMAGKTVLIGGLARNVGFVQALNAGLGVEATALEEPEFVSALGAALLAAEGDLAPELSD